MFRLITSSLTFPDLYPRVDRKPDTATEKGWDIVGGFKLREKVDFMPLQGLQEKFCSCESNLIFLCGSMGMGKTYAFNLRQLYGIDHPGYSGVMISVRLQDSSKGSSIFRDANELFGGYAGCEVSSSGYPTFVWPQWNSSYRLVHSNFNADNPSEWEEFKDYAKKVQAGYIAIDEATQIKQFKMFTFWFGRNRDSSGLTPTMALSFNPEHDHWTTKMLRDGGYLTDDWYLRKDMNGITRYFYVKGETPESIIWGDTPEEVAEAAGVALTEKEKKIGVNVSTMIKSFTMFTGETADNTKLMYATKGQMLGNLHAMGGLLRDVNKGAYFGPIDNEEINVNRQMIHNLWQNPINGDNNMYATMDISSGKAENDKCPMIIWRGLQFIAIEQFSGKPEELAGWIQSRLDKYGVPITNFAFDATGHGYWVQAFTAGIPITWNKRVMQEYDSNGNPVTTDEFFNLRSQLLGKTEVMLKSGLLSCAVPKDAQIPYGHKNEVRRLVDILFDEISLFNTLTKNGKTYYRSTEEFKAKFHFSPDIMMTIAIRAVFELDTRERKQPKPVVPENAYNGLYNGYHSGWGNHRQAFSRTRRW